MTRLDRPEGRPAGVGTQGQDTDRGNDPRGSFVRLTGDAEAMAADLLERHCPAAVAALAVALVDLIAAVGR